MNRDLEVVPYELVLLEKPNLTLNCLKELRNYCIN